MANWNFPLKAFNFRATSGFVADNTNETYCTVNFSSDGGYPQTRACIGQGLETVTFGWKAASGAADRTTSAPIEFAGMNDGANNTGLTTIFRVDLPAIGAYKVALAMGDRGASQHQYWTINDYAGIPPGTFPVPGVISGPFTNIITGAANYADAVGNVLAEANWASQNTAITLNFFSGVFLLVMSDPTGSGVGSTTIAHLEITQLPQAPILIAQNMY
jgi:hypothetical protein